MTNDSDPMMSRLESSMLLAALIIAVVLMLTVHLVVGMVIVLTCLVYLFWKAI